MDENYKLLKYHLPEVCSWVMEYLPLEFSIVYSIDQELLQ